MGTVAKALSLLDHFTQQRPEIGLSDLARLSGLNKATAYRLLTELQAAGFVEQAAAGRAYRLGPEVLRLAALREAAVPILSASRPVLEHVSRVTGETAHLSLVRGARLTALTHVYSPQHATRVMMDDAEILPFHATGSGLAVLAFAAEEFVETVLAGPLAAFTEATQTDPTQLRAALGHVRRSGIAEAVGGFERDVHSRAAPVFDATGAPLGALAVAAPVARMTSQARALIRAELARAARDLTRSLGGTCPPGFPREDAA